MRDVYTARRYSKSPEFGPVLSATAERDGDKQMVKLDFSTIHNCLTARIGRVELDQLVNMLQEVQSDWS